MTSSTIDRPRRTGRPPLTSREQLLDAALNIGFRGLTVGVVTAKVGVKYSTFYRHFASLELLVDALVEDILTDDPAPEDDGWRAELDATASRLAAVLAQWPGMADAVAGLPQPSAWARRAWARLVPALVDAGLATGDAVRAVDAVLTAAGLGPKRGSSAAVGLILDGIAARLDDTRAGRVLA